MKLEIHPIHFSLLFHRIQDIGRGMKKINFSISRNVKRRRRKKTCVSRNNLRREVFFPFFFKNCLVDRAVPVNAGFYKRDTPMLMSNGVITPGQLEAPIFRLPFLYRNRAGLRECPGNYEGRAGGLMRFRNAASGQPATRRRRRGWRGGGAAWNLAFPASSS